jgi:hypothetical protein
MRTPFHLPPTHLPYLDSRFRGNNNIMSTNWHIAIPKSIIRENTHFFTSNTRRY